ncbi:uncharacterized protein N7498_002751 [Penicillium cinerascens]|uniref:Uncharacterized protein n=1 Tax=Penicillium cinerascens TaxID=70096 RepID=A0A9W9NAN5_9EURO|nr:uncharacterized protein N7498_002751 [Penicillium cinerascens]KAJ5216344.1 hypothetical protein N7498_002751 [Penicillium cinerascens]
MGTPSGQLLLGLRRRALGGSGLRAMTRNYSSLNSNIRIDARSHEPTSAELLRFALTSSKNSAGTIEPDRSLRKQVTELLDSEWKSNSPPPALWFALKGVNPMFDSEERRRLQSVADLTSLRNVIERLVVDDGGADRLQQKECNTLGKALERCQRDATYTEILSTLSDITARLQRLKLNTKPQILELGMYYAALNLSGPALRQFLQRYDQLAGPRQTSWLSANRILQAVLQEINSALFENPNHNTGAFLAEITGEGEPKPQVRSRLANCLLGNPAKEHQNWALYLSLLSKLQSVKKLDSRWKKFIKAFDPENLPVCHYAYSVILSLIQAGRSEKAAKFLEDISIRSGDTLPYIGDFQNIHALLDDPVVGEALPDLVQGDHYEKLLEVRMEDMERRLGIRWQGGQKSTDQKSHFGTAPGASWSVFQDQPLFTIDGDCAGYDDPARVYPSLQAHGCSKSESDLSLLMDMLIEQTGNEQEIVAHLNFDSDRPNSIHLDFPTLQWRWCIEHSPIEFSDSLLAAATEGSRNRSPASLGLIRARSIMNGVPQMGSRALHLMQLGSLDLRHGPDETWQPSGYIVTWDRQYGGMVALFVGKNHGVVDPGAAPSNAPFGTLMHIKPSDMPNTLPLPTSRVLRDPMGPYYVDVDPSVDLGFQ